MFEYHCPSCGDQAFSSASYSTVGVCPSCGSSLGDDEVMTVPEPELSASTRGPAVGTPTRSSNGDRSVEA
jgi:transcription initiation factor TFIIIB Brf1 subunit/transcription initiation factor TFIIB